MSKHPKHKPKIKIIKSGQPGSVDEKQTAATPQPPQPPKVDPEILQLQDEITQMKNAYYQINGQSGATLEAIVSNLYAKLVVQHRQLKVMNATVAAMNAKIAEFQKKKK